MVCSEGALRVYAAANLVKGDRSTVRKLSCDVPLRAAEAFAVEETCVLACITAELSCDLFCALSLEPLRQAGHP